MLKLPYINVLEISINWTGPEALQPSQKQLAGKQQFTGEPNLQREASYMRRADRALAARSRRTDRALAARSRRAERVKEHLAFVIQEIAF